MTALFCSMCRWCCGLLSSCTGSSVPLQAEAEVTGEFQLHVHPLSSSALQVIWAEPSGEYGWYKIRYRPAVGNHRWSTIKPPFGTHQCQITRLRPDTSYEIQIENKSLPRQLQQYSSSVFGQTQRGTQTDRDHAAERAPLLR